MGGIEVYPQKEFDEDMEDKSDNDKIRVSVSSSSTQRDSICLTLTHRFLQTECQGTGACCVFVSCHKPLGTLSRVEMSPSIGGDALCRGGQRQRISSERQTSSGKEDAVGDCGRWVTAFLNYRKNIAGLRIRRVTLSDVFCCS